ncbi:rod shape-determining protein RodA [Candidatus Daviesbacteria bacterium RIFCSPHIGHO2_02_FULL_36_13]|uniref:Rod shape-determining protein RodA n=1 Tax=Candidatus Daviesbacteria bacterium RIFCSPHIGHO2_02_FULL_36_13 TaxID=1797768 RepID=A0A1F5JNV8_9BACT|nr:MAG: rod shape-determining protein RodA [Candidatus Daviesbacteria bacterium RIFCSPHIGHO2_02_FULL_36_13]OGE41621.1 MAG: rod shape-determining protein RodA [Candidatus Daviesbacteria bacterium RIFCSPLOWO2_01_FULL_36_8]
MKFIESVNWPIFLVSLSLVSIGILVIYSSSPELAFQQFIYTIVGLILFLFISHLDLHSIRKLINPLFFLTILLLIVVLVLGVETRGSVRWIPLGFFNIQPSEFAKPVILLFIASFWAKSISSWTNIFKSLFLISPILFLVFIQPDLGSTLTLVSIWVGILFVSRVSVKKIIVLILIAALVIPVGWTFLRDYQKQRIVGFLNPQTDPLGRGYNLIQSTIAVGSGEILGRGLGRGTQSRLQFLPEFRTDFIFASIAEEWGFLGCFVILSLYMYLLVFFLRLASQIDDNFSFLIIIGVFSMLLFQVFVNVGMNIGIVPITGITLPLISYGGSSLIVTFVCLGLVASVAKARARIDTEAY